MVVVALEFWTKAQLAWGCNVGMEEQVHQSRTCFEKSKLKQ